MTISERNSVKHRSVAEVIHDLDKGRSKLGLTVLLVCVSFWIVMYMLVRHLF